MESCLNIKADRQEQMEVDDVKGNLPSDVSTLTHPQCSDMEEKEHLQVYLRVRPFTPEESSNGESQDCVSIESPDTVLLKPPSLSLLSRLSVDRSLPQTGQRFQFSQVYGPETTQKGLFEGTVKDLVKDVLYGGNSLVFTYGVTNAGKTFTFLGPDADVGILPRSLDVIFSSIDEQVFSGMSIKPHRCREFTRLTNEQQAEEAAFKRNLFRQLKESERSNAIFLNSTNKTLIEGVSSNLEPSVPAEDRICLQVDTHTKFSVWVSFCEIYNENIHDLLEVVPSGALRRTVLRLSQDVKGNAFVKDLRWIKVNTAEEAYKVMKLGKKNQSFSSTRLNQLSSRSHSVFSIRIMRIEDVGTLRVVGVSELCLCDLAGSERCAKTQNKGERLKEAGNINTSLLILGKCINALRHNQQAKLLQHVPFRESKLTHYLQGFFCGRGKACMIVNINQCASFYEETLNVLKFSAVAQKVVVLSTKPLPNKPQSSASEVSFIGHSDERKAPQGGRRSSSIGWETSLEDVQEYVDQEYEEGNILLNDTMDTANEEDGNENNDKILISKQAHQRQVALMQQLQVQLKKERAEVLLMEARVREEISKEFSELFSEMQNDYNERLRRETEMLEERAETRLEIFKNLIDKMTKAGAVQDQDKSLDPYSSCELESLKRDAEAACKCLQLQGLEEKRMFQEKSSENSRLKKEVEDLGLQCFSSTDEEGCSHERDQLQEALSSLEQERKARQDVLSALQYQTEAREEALASLEEERKAKEEAQATVQELRRGGDEMLTSLEKERRDKEETVAALADLKQSREETLAALHEERSQREEAQSVLEKERKEMSRLVEESEKSQQRFEQDIRELIAKLEAAQQQVRIETERAEQVFVQQQAAEAQLGGRSDEVQEMSSQISVLKLEIQGLEKKVEELKELQKLLEEEKQSSDKILNDLKQQFHEQEKTVELLKSELEESRFKCLSVSSSSAAEEELKRLNFDLQTEVTSLKAKVAHMEEEKDALSKAEAEPASPGMDRTLKEKDRQMEEKLAEVQKNLLEKEAQVTSLLKSLQEAKEQRDEEEIQAVQEARRREAERRRELLAVAHEAIAQKDKELDKKTQEINRLKENAQQDLEKVKSLSVDLQRNEDEASDLREKLADYKKQVQQVQKEISTMREDEKGLRQKLTDAEKTRKQLQSDLANRDRTIQQLKVEQSADARSDQTLQLHNKACKDLEVKERVIEDMRLALAEQEETQAQMEEVLEEKLQLIQELTAEVEKLKGSFRRDGGDDTSHQSDDLSHDLRMAKQEAAQAQERLKLCADKHQAERKKWMEEKLSLIGQAKEAEDKRNQEMRKFADDRERYNRQHVQMESLSSQLAEKEQVMERWRTERDTLVAALEVQLQKLLSSQAEKDKLIQELRQQNTQPPQECGGVDVAELRAALREREADVQRLTEELKALTDRQEAITQVKNNKTPTELVLKPLSEALSMQTAGQRDTRASVSSQGSGGGPSVLDSSEISTENGRTSRFPRPELEISFSPLQPNRMALRRQGEQSAVTVKITRSARKRRSEEMEKSHFYRRSKRRTMRKDEVEVENKRNTKTKLIQSLTPQQEEISSPPRHHDSHSSVRSRREGTLQKIGDFLQSSPTLLGSKAKKMMSLVSGRTDADSAAAAAWSSSSSLSLRAKKNKKKLYRPEISSPMDMPPHPIISREAEERESDHQIIKRRLRSRMVK